MTMMDKPGFYRGRHISAFVEEVRTLMRNKELEKAEELLLHLVDADEKNSRATGMGVAPWYYGKLAAIYRRRRDYAAQVAILERFAEQKHSPGSMPRQLEAQLEKAQLATGMETPLLRTQDNAETEILEEFNEWRKGERSKIKTYGDS